MKWLSWITVVGRIFCHKLSVLFSYLPAGLPRSQPRLISPGSQLSLRSLYQIPTQLCHPLTACLGLSCSAGCPPNLSQPIFSLLFVTILLSAQIHDGTALARALPYETHWMSIPQAGMVEQLDSFTQRNNEVEKVSLTVRPRPAPVEQ